MTTRDHLVAAAELWIGTPYHHAARCPGVGIDCINLLCAVYETAGLIAPIRLPFYPADWMMHRSEELILQGVLEAQLHQVQYPQPGDVALFQFGRCYSHGAVVTDWPELIHAYVGYGVIRGDAHQQPLTMRGNSPRPVKFYSALD